MTTPTDAREPDGYRRAILGGPAIRADIVEVAVARPAAARSFEFLQLLRAREPLSNTWHPVMGHCKPGESALACALRELREESGLLVGPGHRTTLWALEQVHPFFVAAVDAVVLCPRFLALAPPDWLPTLNDEHSHHRWVAEADIDTQFLWPGQRAACREALAILRAPDGPASAALRIHSA